MKFPIPNYIDYLLVNGLQDNPDNLERFNEYARRFLNMETTYKALAEKLGIENA